jgi:hypothetical protein
MFQLFGHVFPVICVRQGRLCSSDRRPGPRKLEVQGGELDFVRIEIFFSLNGIDGALGNADGAVDAFVGVNDQHVGTFAKTVHGADVDAIGVFAADAGFGDDVGHSAIWGQGGCG